MSYFRINIYLIFKFFLLSFFYRKKNIEALIQKLIIKNSLKKFFILTSQLRIGFLILLKYFQKINPEKKEIIFSPYNIPEMISVAKNLNYEVVFCDVDLKTGFFCFKKLERKINHKTSAVVMTNMFNSYEDSLKLRKLCDYKKVNLIEDNAIYFDNFIQKKNKIYSGSIGHYSLYSFNLMKNISALYGGGVSTNDTNFYNFAKKKTANFKSFSIIIYTRQMLIYLILKILSVNFIYKFFFFRIIKLAYKKNIKFLLQIFYPILRFKYQKFPSYYFTKMKKFSKNMVYLQLVNSKIRKVNHSSRKDKNKFYMKLFQAAGIPEINLFCIKDFNFQNYLDFPIVVKDKKKLINFLLNKKIDTRVIHYKNCAKIFGDKKLYANSDILENNLLCLPNHHKISKIYMEFIVERIKFFYSINK
jgi:dTDP-4-amino-4,6-dideoxygalactose transaminase